MVLGLLSRLSSEATEWARWQPGPGCPIGRYAASLPQLSDLSKRRQHGLIDVVAQILAGSNATKEAALSLHAIAEGIVPEALEQCYAGSGPLSQARFTDFRAFDLAYFGAMKLVWNRRAEMVSDANGFAYYLKQPSPKEQ